MRIGGRMHAPHAAAVVHAAAGSVDPAGAGPRPTGGAGGVPTPRRLATLVELRAPMPGWFVPAIGAGDLVTADEVIGQLVVLGRSIAITAGHVRGLAVAPGEPRAVGYGDPLVALDLEARVGGEAPPADAPDDAVAAGRVFRAPTSGRFYGRPAPDKPAFVTAGGELQPGATVCLLEVMKTFHRVTYGGDPARVEAVLVADGDDVNAGDPLLALASP